MKILDGKKLSEKIVSKVKSKVEGLDQRPKLAIILVGDDPGSKKYVEMKRMKGREVGIEVEVHLFGADEDTESIIKKIELLNRDESVTGIMVQLPLPKGHDTMKIINKINPDKDVDGLTAQNLGLLFQGQDCLVAATPLGIMKLLEEYSIELSGRTVALVGISTIIGIPLAGLLRYQNATVLMCHSKTQDIKRIVSCADLLVSATGKCGLVKADWIKDGAVVIDVGFGVDDKTGKVCGDVDFDDVKGKVSYITPVPGGVGPMTVASLLENCIKAVR